MDWLSEWDNGNVYAFTSLSAISCSTDDGTVQPRTSMPTQLKDWLPIVPSSPNKDAPGYGNPRASGNDQGTLNRPLILIGILVGRLYSSSQTKTCVFMASCA
jgi:hypothetical protein